MDATEEEKTQKEMLMALGASKLQAASSFSDLQASNPNSSLDIPIDGLFKDLVKFQTLKYGY